MKKNIQKALQELYEKNQKLTPSMLVKVAAAKKSPLHSCFEWDNAKASRQYRLWQARNLIVRVKIVASKDSPPEKVVHVPVASKKHTGGKEGEYLPMSVVVAAPDKYERAFNEAVKKLKAAQVAVSDLREAADGQEDSVVARLGVALEALSTAQTVMETLH